MRDQKFSNLNGHYINFQQLTQKLKEIAHEKGMTQSELAEGITPREHLNKILNGKRNPSLILLYQLCNKLNVDIRLLIEQGYYVNYEQTSNYIHRMKQCITQGNFDRLEELVNFCSTIDDFKNGIAKQFLTYQKGIIQLKKYHNPSQALEYIEESLSTAFQKGYEGSSSSHFLTLEEKNINIDKAICLFQLGDTEQAINILVSIINNRLAIYENTETYHLLRAHFYLAKFYLETQQINFCLEVAKKGIDLAHCKFVYIYVGDLHALTSLAFHALQNDKEANFHYNKAQDFYRLLGSSQPFKSPKRDFISPIKKDPSPK